MLDRKELNQLFRYAFSLTIDEHDAQDLVQSSIEKSLKKKKEDIVNVSYLRMVIRNQFIDDCRRKKIVAFDSLSPEEPALIDVDDLEKCIVDADHVEKLFKDLDAGDRELIYFWALLGFTASEIAKETEQSRGTILSRLHRIKRKIKQYETKLHTEVSRGL